MASSILAVMLEDIWRAPNIKEVCYGKMNLITECFTLLCLVRPVCKFTRDKKLICVFLKVYNDKLISNHILLMALPPGPIRRHVDSMSTSGGYTSKGLIRDYELWYEYKASTYEEHLKWRKLGEKKNPLELGGSFQTFQGLRLLTSSALNKTTYIIISSRVQRTLRKKK